MAATVTDSWGGIHMYFACVGLPALLIAGAFVVWAIQKALGKNDSPFW